jgi:hypothetical protein
MLAESEPGPLPLVRATHSWRQPIACGALSKLIRTSASIEEGKMARAKIRQNSTGKRLRKQELVVTETRKITTEPKVEVRKPATLAQALTEPEVAVIKPETKARVVKRTVRRRAA